MERRYEQGHAETLDPSSATERLVVRRAAWRLIPFLCFLYFISYLDRVNISFAALQMNGDLGLDKFQYGLGGGLFFVGYLLFQVPSNHVLQKVGARRWLATIMITWGMASFATGFIQDSIQFYVARLVLGAAEAGFFPGLVLYVTYWFPAHSRARIMAGLFLSVPIATVVGAPVSSLILTLFAHHPGFAAWRWLFIIEAVPAIVSAFVLWIVLPEGPGTVSWLSASEKSWLRDRLAADAARAAASIDGASAVTVEIVRYSFVYLGIALGLYGSALWLPQIIKAGGVSDASAALLTAVPYGIGAVAIVLWGRIADGRGNRASNCWLPTLLATLGLLGVTLVSGFVLQLVFLSIAVAGILCALSTFWTLPTAMIPPARMAAAVAIINTTGGAGGFVGPFVVGWLTELTGSFSAALVSLAVGTGASTAILVAAGRGGTRRAR